MTLVDATYCCISAGGLIVLLWLLNSALPTCETVSQDGDCPASDNGGSADNVGSKLAYTAADTLTDEERAAVERAMEPLDTFQSTIGWQSSVDGRRHSMGNTGEDGMRLSIEYVRSLESRLAELRAAADQADEEYRDEISRLRLTEEEREAVDFFSEMEWPTASLQCRARSATIRGLLERLGGRT